MRVCSVLAPLFEIVIWLTVAFLVVLSRHFIELDNWLLDPRGQVIFAMVVAAVQGIIGPPVSMIACRNCFKLNN